jgi:type I restriction enzyme, R subunit
MDSFNKKELSERDVCTKFITPAIEAKGWDRVSRFREEVNLTDGRVIVRGKMHSRGRSRRADYVLYHKPNIPVAIIEAKDNKHSVGDGMQQALDYAEMQEVPFAFSSNGDAFLAHDLTGNSEKVEWELPMDEFPSHDEIWSKYCAWKGYTEESRSDVLQFMQVDEERKIYSSKEASRYEIPEPYDVSEALSLYSHDYFDDGTGKTPRYYQASAINRTIEAISKGKDRVLLVMATGTGKTYTAFQIIWRLWKAGRKKRILYLADRNILIDQTRVNDFKPFGSAMTKIQKRQVDKSYEIYMTLYQAVTGSEEDKNIYKQFSPDFFDLVVVDECHRGSAAEDSAWREILTYFSSATQIGMTATPKETKYVSNIHYFGEPVFTYSLKQGIEDGFLAPYKVVRIDIDKDLSGWRPEQGKRDKYGEKIEDRIFNQKDFDKTLVLEKRTELVAEKITEFLKGTGRYDKTIVFCEDVDHAERMRQALVNENPDLAAENRKYVMRITGDNPEGKAELDNFIYPEERYPVVVTTSKLLSTGVDAQTCKLIVLDQNIRSMSAFKQIIGRGTRINEDYDKYYFTIMDFRKATELFADPDFDGPPIQIYEPGPNETPVPPDDTGGGGGGEGDPPPGEGEPPGTGGEPGEGRRKYVVNDVPVWVMGERTQYLGDDGKLITESMKDFTRKAVAKSYTSLDEFLRKWSSADRKKAVIEELEEQGVFFEELAKIVGKDYDAFDLISHVVFDQPPLTRKERAENVRKRDYFTRYGEKARAVLDALLDKYADEGIENIESMEILKVQPINQLGTVLEIVESFGSKEEYDKAVAELEREIYAA